MKNDKALPSKKEKAQRKFELSKNDISKLLITGALAGIANGFFGSGGGLFLVPLFIHWIRMDEKKSFATSVSIIIPLSLVSLVIFLFNGSLKIGDFWPMLAGGFIGGIISGIVFKKVPIIWLKRIFGVLIIIGGVRAIFLL